VTVEGRFVVVRLRDHAADADAEREYPVAGEVGAKRDRERLDAALVRELREVPCVAGIERAGDPGLGLSSRLLFFNSRGLRR
jgi:hypothetical protein